ncbi:MAG: prepilin-type N-terminal cleavage/methylation domain-containing protein [Gallionella sp.]|nr:prepilin-type N-terminal cleavage/methylation domain-containing protein [Gallionella sp.]MDP1940257.1 prepilin-type N-terminal cleavage/methylation domain-containing protein [Gallionella sp.]
MWKHSKQSGFTLVELAIVLVIIGLILAAVLKGQEMIQNAKVKNVINDLQGVATAYYAYQDRYKAIPGDDAAAASHFNGTNGGGDGLITGLYDAAVAPSLTAESNNFWQHTRMAGFMTGSGTNPPTNALGGVTGIQNGTSGTPIYGMTGPAACVNNIPWKIALAVDITKDDGNSDTGTIRTGATGATTTGNSAAYGASGVPSAATMEGLQTVCMKI